jgi:Protein of unknown function (DUF4089)
MKQDDFDPEVLMDQMAKFVGLTIEPQYRAGVVQHLRAARKIAEPLLAFELDDESEPAPVFKP